MKKYSEQKVLGILNELYSELKEPKPFLLYDFLKEHKISSNTAKILLQGKIIKRSMQKTNMVYAYEWTSPIRPNLIMANMLIFKLQQKSRESMDRDTSTQAIVEPVVENPNSVTNEISSPDVEQKVVLPEVDKSKTESFSRPTKKNKEVKTQNVREKHFSFMWGLISIKW